MHPARSVTFSLAGLALGAAVLVLKAPQAGKTPASAPTFPKESMDYSWAKLVPMVEKARGLTFREVPQLQPASAEEVRACLLNRITKENPPARAALWQRAHETLGFRWQPRVPFPEALAGLILERDGGCYDPGTHQLFFHADATGADADPLRLRLLNFLTRLLLAQHFPAAASSQIGSPNDDSAKAHAALAMGDAQSTALRCLLQEQPQPPSASRQNPPVPYGGAPRFLREFVQFPVAYGAFAVEHLPGSPSGTALNPHYHSPRLSTSAIMQADSPALTPETVEPPAWISPTPPPAYENSLGEFGTLVLFLSLLTHDTARQASAGWRGDRFWFWQDPAGPAGDRLVWKSVWATSGDAQEFSDALAQSYLTQLAIIADPGQSLGQGNYRIHSHNRTITIACTPASRTVTLIHGASTGQPDALAGKVPSPSSR